jgi:hypothetical protein
MVKNTTLTRETRQGRPLFTVETEANGDSRSTYERNPSLVGSLGSLCRYKRFLSCLGFSSRPSTVQNISQSCWVAYLVVWVSDIYRQFLPPTFSNLFQQMKQSIVLNAGKERKYFLRVELLWEDRFKYVNVQYSGAKHRVIILEQQQTEKTET